MKEYTKEEKLIIVKEAYHWFLLQGPQHLCELFRRAMVEVFDERPLIKEIPYLLPELRLYAPKEWKSMVSWWPFDDSGNARRQEVLEKLIKFYEND